MGVSLKTCRKKRVEHECVSVKWLCFKISYWTTAGIYTPEVEQFAPENWWLENTFLLGFDNFWFRGYVELRGGYFLSTLRIQICPKKGSNPTILLWGWGCFDHQTYSNREGPGSLGQVIDFQNRIQSHPKNDPWTRISGLHPFLVTPAGQLHVAPSEVVVPIRLPPFQLLTHDGGTHGTSLVDVPIYIDPIKINHSCR